MSLDHGTSIVKCQTATHDAFLGGRLSLAQPAKGFRAGLESVLLGAAVRATAGEVLDLGAGVGTAALVALSHGEGLAATLAEADPDLRLLADANIAGNGFAGRARTLALDVTAPGAIRAAAGLRTDHYAAVIANPPFFAAGQGTPPPAAPRAAARQMEGDALERWVRTAAAAAAPEGEVVFIMPAESLPPLVAAFARRFGALVLLPLSPRPGLPARRVLLRGIKGARAPLTLLPARSVHGETGPAFQPEIEAVLRAAARLDW